MVRAAQIYFAAWIKLSKYLLIADWHGRQG